jgi:hypothetical protein
MGLSQKLHHKIILRPTRFEVNSWLDTNGPRSIDKYFARLGPETMVINACGVTDPKAPTEHLHLLNTVLPTRILNVVNRLGMKMITFGTILEKNISLGSINSYVRSKQDFVELVLSTPPNSNHLHLQLHTIYGGKRSHKHMFIEQIYHSLVNNKVFEMSSGFQVREYHHIEDEINAISSLLQNKYGGVMELSAGNAIPINQLARAVFKDFGVLELLKFNPALDGEDVFNHFYEKNPNLHSNTFRDPIPGVIQYLKDKLTNV